MGKSAGRWYWRETGVMMLLHRADRTTGSRSHRCQRGARDEGHETAVATAGGNITPGTSPHRGGFLGAGDQSVKRFQDCRER